MDWSNDRQATHVLAKEHFSTAIFAPAWSYEHFPTSIPARTNFLQGVGSIAKAVDRSVWEGFALPENLCCDCRGGRPHHNGDYLNTPIVASSREYPAGSSCYLHTDFTQAFKRENGFLRSCLGSQSILPHLLPTPAPDWKSIARYSGPLLHGQLEDGVLSIRARLAGRVDSHADREAFTVTTSRLGLFKVDMHGNRDLQAIISYSSVAQRKSCTAGFYTGYQNEDAQHLEYKYHVIPLAKRSDSLDAARRDCKAIEAFRLKPRQSARLVEIGVFCEDTADSQEEREILRLTSLTIAPPYDVGIDIIIQDIRMTQRGQGPNAELRLTWSWDDGGLRSTCFEIYDCHYAIVQSLFDKKSADG